MMLDWPCLCFPDSGPAWWYSLPLAGLFHARAQRSYVVRLVLVGMPAHRGKARSTRMVGWSDFDAASSCMGLSDRACAIVPWRFRLARSWQQPVNIAPCSAEIAEPEPYSARRWLLGSRMDIDPHIEDDNSADLKKTIADLIKRKYEAVEGSRRIALSWSAGESSSPAKRREASWKVSTSPESRFTIVMPPGK